MQRKKVVVLSGAGISAESGIKTFRDAGGLWEKYDIMEVASPKGWRNNFEMVLEFYNQRRRQLHKVSPNAAHYDLVKLEERYDVVIITQNIDDLHERAGSTHVLHLHGELLKARSTQDDSLVYDWSTDILAGDQCELGSQLRPHIVWFGEHVPMMEQAASELMTAEIVLIVGTSLQVYPAAGLVAYAPPYAMVYYIDPDPGTNFEVSLRTHLHILKEKATIGVRQVVTEMMSEY